MRRPVKIAGKVIDWRDSSIVTIQVAAGQTCNLLYLPSAAPCTIEIDTGDGNVYQTNISIIDRVYYQYVRTYISSGIYKINIKSTQPLNGFGCYYIASYNSGYFKIPIQNIIYCVNAQSSQDITSTLGILNYLNISNSNVKVNLNKLVFNNNCNNIQLVNSINLYGQIRVPNILYNINNVLMLRGSNVAAQGVYSFLEIIQNTPNCLNYDIESYHLSAPVTVNSNLIDIYNAIKNRPIAQYIMLNVNAGVVGDGTELFNYLYNIGCGYIYLTMSSNNVYMQLGTQVNDYTTLSSKIIYLNRVDGLVSNFNFKFKTTRYLYLVFLASATGHINNIANVTQDAGDYVWLTLSAINVQLDVSNLKNINCSAISLNALNNFSGDISTLGSRTMCTSWLLTNLTSTTITGWSGLITNIYANRAAWASEAKSFACPNVMKAALGGAYQAPTGFVKGSSDGTPTTDRERIYVLVNNYNWTFTNI